MAAIEWAGEREIDPEEVRNFVSLFDLKGALPIALTLSPGSVDALTRIRTRLSEIADMKLSVSEGLGFLLVSYRGSIEGV